MGERTEMKKNLVNVEEMVYPGRVIIIGKSLSGEDVVMYALTGRSPSSQARMLLIDEAEKKIFVKPTDEDTLKTGNPELLVYPAVIYGSGIAVSNGKQTDDVFTSLGPGKDPIQVQIDSLVNVRKVIIQCGKLDVVPVDPRHAVLSRFSQQHRPGPCTCVFRWT